ncbi:thiamine phosphate synthase [Salidesulfovibrio brasiliensis]|uniref:thiamine phosphate synthase n=1 Tax=Salidesulfovibrio brasiliensis TaxID=221711 RepID=UPI0006CFB0B0|nr:thiamine phosphate synthase [Salidesulfovibrio brasiliensis]
MKPRFNLSCYLVTDRSLCRGRSLTDVVAEAVAGGVTMVQLREKNTPTRDFLAQARKLKQILAPQGIPLIINDRIDIALSISADGVHIGQSDMPYNEARRLLGPEAIIGLSIDTDEQVIEAQSLDVDYLGLGPVFPTKTKKDHSPALGLEGFTRRRSMTRHPSVAIGSVTAKSAPTLRSLGADGIAVVSAICAADDPQKAAAELRDAFDASGGPPGA